MKMVPYAKLTKRDVQELDSASERLVAVVQTIQQSRYANAPMMIQALNEVHATVERIKLKGAGAIVRDLQRKGLLPPSDDPEAPAAELGDLEADQGATAAERV